MLRVSGSMIFELFGLNCLRFLCFLNFQKFECHRDSATGIAKVMRLSAKPNRKRHQFNAFDTT